MHKNIHEISEAIHESQIMTAIIFGMFIQFFFGGSRTLKIAVTITSSSVFVAMYVVSPAIELIGISEESKVAIGLYALSSLISMEMLAILLIVLPGAFKQRLQKYLEVKNVTK